MKKALTNQIVRKDKISNYLMIGNRQFVKLHDFKISTRKNC